MCTTISLALAYTVHLFFFLILFAAAITITVVGFFLLSLFSSCRPLYTLHRQTDPYTYIYVAENIDRKTHRHEKEKKVNKKKGQKVVDAARGTS